MFNNTSTVNTTTPSPVDTDYIDYAVVGMCIQYPFVLLGIIGNLSVIVMMIFKKRQAKALTNNDVFLLGLACSDFLFICLDTGMFTYNLKYFAPTNFTLLYCIVYYPLVSVAYTAGVFIIAAMAVYRCWVITNPFKPKIKQMWIYLCILAIWISAVIVFLPLSIGSAGPGCRSDEFMLHYAYVFFTSTLQYPLPLLVMIISYSIIGLYLRKKRMPKTSYIARGRTMQIQGEETSRESIALAKTVGTIVLLFAILMLPVQIGFHAVASFETEQVLFNYVYYFGNRLAVVHSALDPYLYTIRTPQYRQVMLNVLLNYRRGRSGSGAISSENKTRSLSFTPSITTVTATNGEKDRKEHNDVQLKEMDVKL